jgi:Tfp pilus assembly protein PilN
MDKRMTQIFQSTFPEEKAIVDSFQQMKAKMAEMKKKSAFSIDRPQDIRRIDLLKELTTRIPKDLDLKIGRMVIGNEDILITGNTNTFNSVNAIKGQLEGSSMFSQVTISSTNLDRAGSRVDFTLTIRF